MIHHDQIVASDLVKALPAFAKIPGDAVVGYSPAPGARRVLEFPELEAFARRYGTTAPPDAKVCVEWRLRPLTEADVRSALRDALNVSQARIDILAISATTIPEGKLLFPLSGLSASHVADPNAAVTWRGNVLYGDTRKFSLWVRIRASASMTRVVATELILPGQTITESQVRLETYESFPLQEGIARNVDEVTGRVLRRAVQAGMPVYRTDLSAPFLVRRGDLAKVTVISGGAQLSLDAEANGSGRQGDIISLTNPRTGKVFRGRIDGKGSVRVTPGPVVTISRVQ